MRSAHTVVVLAAALAFAGPASALPPGVFVDPGSPAGKEYSFPLSVLRGASAGHTAPGGTAEPLFGIGVKPAGRAATGTARARRAANLAAAARHRRASGASHAGAARINPGERRVDTELASLVRPSSDMPQIVLIVVALLVVAVASGAGIAAARRRS